MKMSRITGLVLIVLGCLVWLGCNSSPTESTTANSETTAPQKKEPVAYTGKSCISQIAYYATKWQPDALPISIESVPNSEDNGQDGKATVWRGTFGSATRRSYKVFTCSGSRAKDAPPQGVTADTEIPASPEMARVMFQQVMLIVDSDAAAKTAQQNGGDGILKKDAQQPVMYSLAWDAKNRQLDWVVIYGTSRNDSKGLGVIDASSGKFLRGGK